MAERLPLKLRLFQNATSLGGVESLADYRYHHSKDVSPLLVRLSIGLENPMDLCWDLYEGMRALLTNTKRNKTATTTTSTSKL